MYNCNRDKHCKGRMCGAVGLCNKRIGPGQGKLPRGVGIGLNHEAITEGIVKLTRALRTVRTRAL